MKICKILLILLCILNLSTVLLFAASLNKYNSGDYKQTVIVKSDKSPEEIAISNFKEKIENYDNERLKRLKTAILKAAENSSEDKKKLYIEMNRVIEKKLK